MKKKIIMKIIVVGPSYEDYTAASYQNEFMKELRNSSESYYHYQNAGDITIKELAETIVDVVGYKNDYEWDTSKPNGTPRKVLNVDKIKSLGWEPKISLREGIESTYEWFKENVDV